MRARISGPVSRGSNTLRFPSISGEMERVEPTVIDFPQNQK